MAPIIKVESIERRLQLVHTRMPFRYGSAKLVRCPHLYMVATIRDGQGRTARGIAADSLPPKWFDKDPAKDFREELVDQLQVIRWAADAATAHEPATAFRLWLDVYNKTFQQATEAGLPDLLAGFGPSLVERAINDAVGHLLDQPFHALLKNNALGIELDALDEDLRSFDLQSTLAPPLHQVAARHTVGLADPIRTTDIVPEDRLNDGLPQSLEEVVDFYGVTYFKIKVQNQLENDLDRLTAIANLLDERLPDTHYRCTLDGNEQYDTIDALEPLLAALCERPALHRLADSVLFIEQPLARSVALDAERCRAMTSVTKRFPVIIDESDGSLDSYRRALELGYSGTSHKNCKNTFKSLLNFARSHRLHEQTDHTPILSAEDLANIGVVAVQQDLTALTCLGITHVERNGHHYFRGLSHLNEEEQQRARQGHSDLYTQGDGYVRLNIQQGQLHCRSLHETAGLGVAAWPQIERFTLADDFDISREF